MARDERMTFRMTFHAQTASGVKLSETGSGNDGVWLPKSQIEIDLDEDAKEGDEFDVVIPRWLALKNDIGDL